LRVAAVGFQLFIGGHIYGLPFTEIADVGAKTFLGFLEIVDFTGNKKDFLLRMRVFYRDFEWGGFDF